MSGPLLEIPDEFLIDGNKLTIGRGRENGFILADMSVSRRHCRLEKTDDEKWFVVDSSANGILLNGEPITKQSKTELPNGCCITLTDKIYYVFENVPEDPNDVASQMKTRLRRVQKPIELDQTVINLCDDSVLEVVPVNIPPRANENDTQPQNADQNDNRPSPVRNAVLQNATVAPLDPMKEELTCSICAEIFIEATLLDCKHTFCGYCIAMWKKTQNICPICRAKITREPVRSLVIDNCCNTVMLSYSKEEQERREENIKHRKAEMEKAKNKQPAGREGGRGRGRAGTRRGRGGRVSTRNTRNAVVSIEISSSDTDEDLDDLSLSFLQDELMAVGDMDDYMMGYTGIPGRYYGGYGQCYICHQPGHWSNGCPNR